MAGAIRDDFRHATNTLRSAGPPAPLVVSDGTTLGELRDLLKRRYPHARSAWLRDGVGSMLTSISGMPASGRGGPDDPTPRPGLFAHFRAMHPTTAMLIHDLVMAILHGEPKPVNGPKANRPTPRPAARAKATDDLYDSSQEPMAAPPGMLNATPAGDSPSTVNTTNTKSRKLKG